MCSPVWRRFADNYRRRDGQSAGDEGRYRREKPIIQPSNLSIPSGRVGGPTRYNSEFVAPPASGLSPPLAPLLRPDAGRPLGLEGSGPPRLAYAQQSTSADNSLNIPRADGDAARPVDDVTEYRQTYGVRQTIPPPGSRGRRHGRRWVTDADGRTVASGSKQPRELSEDCAVNDDLSNYQRDFTKKDTRKRVSRIFVILTCARGLIDIKTFDGENACVAARYLLLSWRPFSMIRPSCYRQRPGIWLTIRTVSSAEDNIDRDTLCKRIRFVRFPDLYLSQGGLLNACENIKVLSLSSPKQSIRYCHFSSFCMRLLSSSPHQVRLVSSNQKRLRNTRNLRKARHAWRYTPSGRPMCARKTKQNNRWTRHITAELNQYNQSNIRSSTGLACSYEQMLATSEAS